MNNLFIGLIYDDKEINWISKNNKSGFEAAANNFQWSFINGLKENLNGNLDVFSFLPIGTWPFNYRKLFIKTKHYDIPNAGKLFQIGFINIFLIKEIYRLIVLFFLLIKWTKKNPNGGTIYVYSLYTPFLISLFFYFKLIKKNHYCLIVPDLMGKFGVLAPLYSFLGIKQRIDSYFQLKFSKGPNSYVLLTKYMAKPLDILNKPFIVIEGLVYLDEFDLTISEEGKNIVESNKRIIFYYGSLNKEYGIDTLFESFLKIENINYELWICGPLSQSDFILEYSKKDSRIIYKGFLMKDELLKTQKLATILINPRPNIGEFVKYSFPSKISQYMLSGKPVIMFKLDGIPEEYYDYVYLMSSFDIDIMAVVIEKVCSLSLIDLYEFGDNAKKFISVNKNVKVQTKNVFDFIENQIISL